MARQKFEFDQWWIPMATDVAKWLEVTILSHRCLCHRYLMANEQARVILIPLIIAAFWPLVSNYHCPLSRPIAALLSANIKQTILGIRLSLSYVLSSPFRTSEVQTLHISDYLWSGDVCKPNSQCKLVHLRTGLERIHIWVPSIYLTKEVPLQ